MSFKRKSLKLAALSLILAHPFAYAFEAISMGNANANQGAGALSAATNIYNPAGLTLFDHPEISLSMISGTDQLQFNGTATNNTPGLAQPYIQSGTASTRASGNIPGFFAVYPINNRIASSLAVYSPLNGDLKFPDDSLVRYEQTVLHLASINVSPALAFKITPQWSFGLGLDANRILLDSTSQQVNVEAPDASTDYTLDNYARSWAFGWHTGLMYQLSQQTRFGVSYTSKISQHPSGSSKLTFADDLLSEADNFRTDINIPYVYRLGMFHQFNNRWTLMSQVHYIGWGVDNVITGSNITDGPGAPNITRQDFPMLRNTWGGSVAANYKIDDQWLLRGGLGVDQSPSSSSAHQQLTSPNNTVETLSVGAHYQITKMVGLDGAYAHEFMNNITTTNYNPSTNIGLNGTYKNQLNAFGIELTWKFA